MDFDTVRIDFKKSPAAAWKLPVSRLCGVFHKAFTRPPKGDFLMKIVKPTAWFITWMGIFNFVI